MNKAILFFIIGLFPLYIQAQSKPEVIMHRTQDSTKNESGWYIAKSTEGNFAVLLPIPFNDFTVKSGGELSYTVGGKSEEGVKISVSKTGKKKDVNLDELVKSFKASNIVSNVSKKAYRGFNAVYFEVSDQSSGALIKYIETKNSLFILIIEFPLEYRGIILGLSDGFFNSLDIKE